MSVIFTTRELQKLYNNCKIQYNPAEYDLKDLLIESAKLIPAQYFATNADFKYETALQALMPKVPLQELCSVSFLNFENMVKTMPSTPLFFVQHNNLHFNNRVFRFLNKTVHDKTTNSKVLHALVLLITALKSKNSACLELTYLMTFYSFGKFEYLRNLEMFSELMQGKTPAQPVACQIIPSDFLAVRFFEIPITDMLTIPNKIAELCIALYLEVAATVNLLPDSDDKQMLSILLEDSYKHSLSTIRPFIDSVEPEVLPILNMSSPKDRYEAIINCIVAHATEIPALTDMPEATGLLNIAMNFIIQYWIKQTRVATCVALYKYCEKNDLLSAFQVPESSSFEDLLVEGLTNSGAGSTGSTGLGQSTESTTMSMAELVHQTANAFNPNAPTGISSKAYVSAFYNDLANMVGKTSNSGYDYNIKYIKPDKQYENTYVRLSGLSKLVASRLTRQIREIRTYNEGGKNPGLVHGKLDCKNLYKYKTDGHIFYNNTYKIRESDLAFGIILDASGSMAGKGISDGMATMIVLHEVLKGLGINHSIVSHNSNTWGSCNINVYQTFKGHSKYAATRNNALASIASGNCNCDSGVLHYMASALHATGNKDKICLIFSDGEPSNCSEAELTNQIRVMEKSGIKVIGIGIDFSGIKEYYKECANGRNMKEMFDIVTNILKQYILDKKE